MCCKTESNSLLHYGPIVALVLILTITTSTLWCIQNVSGMGHTLYSLCDGGSVSEMCCAAPICFLGHDTTRHDDPTQSLDLVAEHRRTLDPRPICLDDGDNVRLSDGHVAIHADCLWNLDVVLHGGEEGRGRDPSSMAPAEQ